MQAAAILQIWLSLHAILHLQNSIACRRKVTISKFTGKPTVNIREYYEVLALLPSSSASNMQCKHVELHQQGLSCFGMLAMINSMLNITCQVSWPPHPRSLFTRASLAGLSCQVTMLLCSCTFSPAATAFSKALTNGDIDARPTQVGLRHGIALRASEYALRRRMARCCLARRAPCCQQSCGAS